VNIDPTNMVSRPVSVHSNPERPELICTFCKGIRSFVSVVGYWSHLVHKHEEVEEEKRAQHVQRSASVGFLLGASQ